MIFQKNFKTNKLPIHNMSKKSQKAFSLIELSIVLVIISILITGTLSVSISSVNSARYSSTKNLMESLYVALGNYVKINGHLPCPASLNIAKGVANYGSATGVAGDCTVLGGVTNVSGNIVYGMIPVNDLGLLSDNGEDAFGTKLSYAVDRTLTDPATFDDRFNGTIPTGIMSVDDNGSAINADLIIISHGANKSGGYAANSTSRSTDRGDASEQENDDQSTNNSFVANNINSDEFDDILLAKEIATLISDFDAFEQIKCAVDSNQDQDYGGFSVTWGEGYYNANVTSIENCPNCTQTSGSGDYTAGNAKATRLCQVYGVWGTIIESCLESATPCP